MEFAYSEILTGTWGGFRHSLLMNQIPRQQPKSVREEVFVSVLGEGSNIYCKHIRVSERLQVGSYECLQRMTVVPQFSLMAESAVISLVCERLLVGK